MRLYFVRHGESELNVKDIHQHPEVALSKTGEKQAKAVANRFKKITIDKILSSDYMRAKQTAEEIAKVTGKTIEFTELLRERRRPSELIGKAYKGLDAKRIYQTLSRHVHDPDWHYSDEENFFDAVKRSQEFIKFIGKKKEQNIAVVAHGAIIKFIIASMMLEKKEELLTPQLFNKWYFFLRAMNTGITVCEKRHSRYISEFLEDPKDSILERWHLVTWNDHAHLG